MRLIIVTMIALLLSNCINAATYMVGDGINWVEPPTTTIYSIWASTHVFAQGDVLVFNFNSGIHNVAEVTKDAYKKCNTSSLISVHYKSPVRISLHKRSIRYFISTLNNDCQNGQKLAINVLQYLPPPLPSTTLPPKIAPGLDSPALPLGAAAPNSSTIPLAPSRNSAAPLYFYHGVSFLI
ncbi:Umecyanin, partial [Bienertia sinuspersici]